MTYVNLLSVIFMLLYAPGSYLAMYLVTKYGLRTTILTGSALNAAGAVLPAEVTTFKGRDVYEVIPVVRGVCFGSKVCSYTYEADAAHARLLGSMLVYLRTTN